MASSDPPAADPSRRHSVTTVSLWQENAAYRGTGGVSAENRSLAFIPAFLDMETNDVHLSRFADGSQAPMHMLDGLPDKVVLSRDAGGEVSAVKPTIIAGFERGGRFYTREQASRVVTQMRDATGLLSRPVDLRLLVSEWERFLVGQESLGRLIRPVVGDSWRRCKETNVDPSLCHAPLTVAGATLESLRQRHTSMRRAAFPILRKASEQLYRSNILMLLTDPVGVILDVFGDFHVYDKAYNINLVEGGLWAEAAVGTNAIGTALAAQQPVQLYGGEHFCEGIKRWTCSADVICDPCDGQPLGVLDLSSLTDTFENRNLHFVMAAARKIEAALAEDYIRSRKQAVDAIIDVSKRWRSDGLLGFDNHGRLVKFNTMAHTALHRHGIDIALTPQTRVAAFDLDLPEQERRSLRPLWLRPQWLQPVSSGALRVGTLIVIPAAASHDSQ